MEVRFELGYVGRHSYLNEYNGETIIDNIVDCINAGMKRQCVYNCTEGHNYYSPLKEWGNNVVNALKKRGLDVEIDKMITHHAVCHVGDDAIIEFRQTPYPKPKVLEKYGAVHWTRLADSCSTLFGKYDGVWFFYARGLYGNLYHNVISSRRKISVRVIYHGRPIDNKTENEGDIGICRQCEYCGQNNATDKNANKYVFKELSLDDNFQLVDRYQYTLDEVIEAYNRFISVPERPGVHRDFFGARTDRCGERFLVGEEGKEVKEVMYVKKGLCPYAAEHLVTAASRKK